MYVYQARIQDLGEGGGARFLGTKPFTKFRNKSSKFRYKNRAKRDKVREAPKICARSAQKIFAPP